MSRADVADVVNRGVATVIDFTRETREYKCSCFIVLFSISVLFLTKKQETTKNNNNKKKNKFGHYLAETCNFDLDSTEGSVWVVGDGTKTNSHLILRTIYHSCRRRLLCVCVRAKAQHWKAAPL